LITESHITNERFLVYINDLLSSGEIAELYTEDDKMNIVNIVRPKVKADGKPDTPDECWSWYIDKVVANLHVCLCVSPVGEGFRRRSKRFPALVTCTVIDWFHAWPTDALQNVAKNKLTEVELGADEVRDAVINFMPFSFDAVNTAGKLCFETERRHVYTTPKSFLELILLFSNMLDARRAKLLAQKEMYETG
jgi:dynein heavy chain